MDHLSHSSQAEEDSRDIDINQDEVKEPEGEDLNANMDRDYEDIPVLDQYEGEGIDDSEQVQLNPMQREEAQNLMAMRDERDAAAGTRTTGRYAHIFPEDSMDAELNAHLIRLRGNEEDTYEQVEQEPLPSNQEMASHSIYDMVSQPRWQKQLQKRFQNFLEYRNADEQGRQIYIDRIKEAMAHNDASLIVEFDHLSLFDSQLTQWLLECPKHVLPLLNQVTYATAVTINPSYEMIQRQLFVRINKIPVEDKLRELKQQVLSQMVRVRGVVTKRTAILAKLWQATFRCTKCGMRKGPIVVTEELNDIGLCSLCQAPGPFSIDETQTYYSNFQRVTLQEPPQDVPAGRMPRHKTVILTHDLVDKVKPGDQVIVTGVYLNQYSPGQNATSGIPLFDTLIEANHVEKIGELQEGAVTNNDREQFKRFAYDDINHFNVLRQAVAPSIYGMEHQKTGLLLAMAGGCSKNVDQTHKIRGDINLLLLGDPGLGKSQLLKWVNEVFPRSVMTSGKGASAVGLTAGVHKDLVTREWTLEGGAMVLADKGICLIDEFDKMNDKDRVSIHEAMEQQTISISKAGIISTLQARCAVIAGANPIRGEYDDGYNFADNVNLSEPILSRFDLLFVMRDVVDRHRDYALGQFIMQSHIKANTDIREDYEEDVQKEEAHNEESAITQTFLRKYLMYARTFEPMLDSSVMHKLTHFYAKIRKVSDNFGGIKLTPRHLESIIRISEAKAKLSLRRHVSQADIEFAQDMMINTFIKSQKRSLQMNLRSRLGQFLIEGGDKTQTFLSCLSLMVDEKKEFTLAMVGSIPAQLKLSLKAFEEKVAHYGMAIVSEFLRSREFQEKYKLNLKERVIEVK